MASTSRRLQAMVEGLMGLARIEDDELVTARCNTRMLLDEAVELLSNDIRTTGARIDVGALPVLSCNATAIVQLFQNLLSNAIKYGGRRPVIEVEATWNGSGWCFTVSDRGPGLPDGPAAGLFELFERGPVHGQAPGTGIGLAICRRIVDRHGGLIWCRQRHGGGAEFGFTLPGDRPQRDRQGHQPRSPGDADGARGADRRSHPLASGPPIPRHPGAAGAREPAQPRVPLPSAARRPPRARISARSKSALQLGPPPPWRPVARRAASRLAAAAGRGHKLKG